MSILLSGVPHGFRNNNEHIFILQKELRQRDEKLSSDIFRRMYV